MVTFRELMNAFRNLQIDRSRPVLVHASLSSFGDMQGGAEAMLGALRSAFDTLLVPTFTFKTMLIPEAGPENNGITYGSGQDQNRLAEFFSPDMPADPMMGVVSETLRRHPAAQRSDHPILSFAGIHAAQLLEAQSLTEPLGPLHMLRAAEGWVLLLGVDHTVNTTLHYAERVAGRKQFIRWALTPRGIIECPGIPGCSNGFQDVVPRLEGILRQAQVGPAVIQAVPVEAMVEIVVNWLAEDPLALLCAREDCECCNAVREAQARSSE